MYIYICIYIQGMAKGGTARAKLGQSCFQCKRVASPWSRTSRVVAARGRRFVSSYLVLRVSSFSLSFVFVVVRFVVGVVASLRL